VIFELNLAQICEMVLYRTEILSRQDKTKHGRSREFRMHMKNPAQTGSGVTCSKVYKVFKQLQSQTQPQHTVLGSRILRKLSINVLVVLHLTQE
jgi:hypothetical protein